MFVDIVVVPTNMLIRKPVIRKTTNQSFKAESPSFDK